MTFDEFTMESMNAQHNDERNADRERQYRQDEYNYEDTESDELTPEQLAEKAEAKRDAIREEQIDGFEIYKPGEPLLPKMMGDDYPKFFKVLDPEQAYEVEQEINADHALDNKF